MTTRIFIAAVEGYYGAYPRDALRDAVLQYVQKTYSEADLDVLYNELVLNVGTEYKAVPDIKKLRETTEAWNNTHVESKAIGGGLETFRALPEPGESYLTKEEQASAWEDIGGKVKRA